MYFNMPKQSFLEVETDAKYFQNIQVELNGKSNPRFAYLRDYKDKDLMEYKQFLFVPDNRISHISSNYVPQCLSVFDIPDNVDKRYCNKSTFAFYNYVLNEKAKGTFVNLELSKKRFVVENKIEYLIIEKGAKLSSELKSMSDTSYINRVNGNIFVVLKTK